MNPLISFIVPVYNQERYIRECIESVLQQTDASWELILVDDGSTDNSGAICDRYCEKDERIHVIHKANTGQYDTRMCGIRAAKGVYCTGLDADDYIEKNCVEVLKKLSETADYDIMAWNMQSFGEGKTGTIAPMSHYGEYTREDYLCYVAGSGNHSFCNKLIKMKLLTELPPSEAMAGIKHSEDYVMICPAICRANSIMTIEDVLYNYRQISGSVTHLYSVDRIVDDMEGSLQARAVIQTYGLLTPKIAEAENISLLKLVGYGLKQVYKQKMINGREYEVISSHPMFEEIKRYETLKNLTFDVFLFMKLFRRRSNYLLSLLFSR